MPLKIVLYVPSQSLTLPVRGLCLLSPAWHEADSLRPNALSEEAMRAGFEQRRHSRLTALPC